MKGFSLIEALVVVALLAILAGLAAPSFNNLFDRFRVSGQREELIASINLARAEAIRRGQPVVIRRITGCAVVLAANNDWSCGWNVFADLNANNALDASDVVIQEVSVALRTRVTKPGAVSQEFLTVNQYSRITQGAQRFEVIPDGGVAASGQAICISSGARIRSVEGTTACT